MTMGRSMRAKVRALICALTICGSVAAHASPWAEVGDNQLRSDVELLANAGVLNVITTQWPLPWSGILTQLRNNGLAGQPDYVREAADRVLRAGEAQVAPGFHTSAYADGTNDPSVVRGFDALGREDGQAQVSGEFMGQTSAIRLSVGAEYTHFTHQTKFLPDGSYAAQMVGGAMIYAGYVTHWWGPGWVSALSLSNNARPFPHVGIERVDNAPFRTPLLSWLGPWQAEFFAGVLDGPRTDRNTVYDGLRIAFDPLPGLEIGLARTDEICGEHHDCNPLDYFDLRNSAKHIDSTNDEADIDLRYTNRIGRLPFEIYAQFMNEDTNPIIHSYTSHLFGGSVWVPAGGAPLRLTLEYADTVPTLNIFSFDDLVHGAAYNNFSYVDGMRYRGRSLGASLDSDSRLLTAQASWRGGNGFVYTVSYDHAAVSSSDIGQYFPTDYNAVTTAPVKINMGVARLSMPFHGFSIDLEGRVQDDQPRPHHGAAGAVELALKVGL
jgi:hypothetical protein